MRQLCSVRREDAVTEKGISLPTRTQLGEASLRQAPIDRFSQARILEHKNHLLNYTIHIEVAKVIM